MKKLSTFFTFGKNKTEPVKAMDEPISFIVVDEKAKLEASKILSKVKIPSTPSLHALEKAYLFGDSLRRKLHKNEIQVIQKNNLSKEDAYQQNVTVYEHLIDQRNAILGVIENMVQPVIKNVAGVNIQMGEQNDRIANLERQVQELQEMLNKVYGKSPKMLPRPGGKIPWSQPVKDAANLIIRKYEADCKVEIKQYRHLRDASDEFYEQYQFIYKTEFTKDMLYENVKKANLPWGKRGE